MKPGEAKKFIGKLVEVQSHHIGILMGVLDDDQFPYLIDFGEYSDGGHRDTDQFYYFNPVYQDDPRLSDRGGMR